MSCVEVMISLANSISNTVFLLARFDVVESFREGVKKNLLVEKVSYKVLMYSILANSAIAWRRYPKKNVA